MALKLPGSAGQGGAFGNVLSGPRMPAGVPNVSQHYHAAIQREQRNAADMGKSMHAIAAKADEIAQKETNRKIQDLRLSFHDRMQDFLYNPSHGLMVRQGRDAIGNVKRYQEYGHQSIQDAVSGWEGDDAETLGLLLKATFIDMRGPVAQHEYRQREAYDASLKDKEHDAALSEVAAMASQNDPFTVANKIERHLGLISYNMTGGPEARRREALNIRQSLYYTALESRIMSNPEAAIDMMSEIDARTGNRPDGAEGYTADLYDSRNYDGEALNKLRGLARDAYVSKKGTEYLSLVQTAGLKSSVAAISADSRMTDTEKTKLEHQAHTLHAAKITEQARQEALAERARFDVLSGEIVGRYTEAAKTGQTAKPFTLDELFRKGFRGAQLERALHYQNNLLAREKQTDDPRRLLELDLLVHTPGLKLPPSFFMEFLDSLTPQTVIGYMDKHRELSGLGKEDRMTRSAARSTFGSYLKAGKYSDTQVAQALDVWEREVDSRQKRMNRQLDANEYGEVTNSLIAKVVTDKGLIWDSTKPAFEVLAQQYGVQTTSPVAAAPSAGQKPAYVLNAERETGATLVQRNGGWFDPRSGMYLDEDAVQGSQPPPPEPKVEEQDSAESAPVRVKDDSDALPSPKPEPTNPEPKDDTLAVPDDAYFAEQKRKGDAANRDIDAKLARKEKDAQTEAARKKRYDALPDWGRSFYDLTGEWPPEKSAPARKALRTLRSEEWKNRFEAITGHPPAWYGIENAVDAAVFLEKRLKP